MEKKEKKIEVIDIKANPERKAKKLREEQVLENIKKEMKARERAKIAQARRKRKQKKKMIKLGMAGMASALAFTVGSYAYHKLTNHEESTNNLVVEQDNKAEEVDRINYVKSEDILKCEEENLLACLKNMYVEQLEEMTGDTSVTTEDISLETSYESHVFIDNVTGEIITHGDTPSETEQKLMNAGISYSIENNVKVYKTRNKEGKAIDCIMIKNGMPTKVTIGEQYGEYNPSIMYEMGRVIPDGLDCIEYMERGDKNSISESKAKFMKSLEEFEKTRESKKMVDPIEDEMEL